MAKLEELSNRCKELGIKEGIDVKPSRVRVNKIGEHYQPWQDTDASGRHLEFSVRDYEKAIQKYFINKYEQENTLNPFMKSILRLDSPMLALQIKNHKKEVQDQIWTDDNNWIFQEKIDGCRCMLCYSKEFGWDMYSRNKSVKDCLPISYKNKLLMPEVKQEVLDRGRIHDFIIDTELVPLNKTINDLQDGTQLVADTQLNLVTSILGSLDDLSHKMQSSNPLKFIAFDLIMINGEWQTNKLLFERDKKLNILIPWLKLAGMDVRLEKVKSTMADKHSFYDQILSCKGEGVVAKDLNSSYDLLGKRAGEWVKIKRTMSQSILMEKLGDTIDAFVTGFKEGTPGTSNAGLVGALEFSIYLTDDNNNYILDEFGQRKVHQIATISGLSDELKRMLTTKDMYGNVALNKNFYGKVATVDGQDISSRNLRFDHATFQGWRPDRDSESCKLRKSFIESLVL